MPPKKIEDAYKAHGGKKMRKREKLPRLYWAYASNLDPHQMRIRCPKAKRVGKLILPNGILTFRNRADIEITQDKSCVVPGGLWEVTPECEEHLDKCEGYFHQKKGNHYSKWELTLKMNGQVRKGFFYRLEKPDGIAPPDQSYLESIRNGYRYFGLDEAILEDALQRSWDMKEWSQEMLKRWHRRGRMKLARPYNRSTQ